MTQFDSYSEAWSKPTFEVKSIKELMRLTEEFEGIEGLRQREVTSTQEKYLISTLVVK